MNNEYWQACLKHRVILEDHFVLTSGRHSNIYGHKDAIYCQPYLYSITINNLIIMANNYVFDAVTGPAVAGIALASPISLYYGKIFTYPEKKNGKMVFRQVYQDALKDKRVLLLEDVITTGGSVQKTIDAVQEASSIVEAVLCIWNRAGWTCEIPVVSIVDTKAASWTPEECPMCKDGIELKDPKA